MRSVVICFFDDRCSILNGSTRVISTASTYHEGKSRRKLVVFIIISFCLAMD